MFINIFQDQNETYTLESETPFTLEEAFEQLKEADGWWLEYLHTVDTETGETHDLRPDLINYAQTLKDQGHDDGALLWALEKAA